MRAFAQRPKLVINKPGDSYEQEADRVSEQITRMPQSRVQRTSLDAGRPVAGDVAPPIVHDVLRAPGRSLDPQTRAFMEPRLGHDFSRVRIHADPSAGDAADAVQAHAFTVGSDIVFGSGKFAPSTPSGRQLLAHELTHVVQQGATLGRLQRQPKAGKDSLKPEPGEREEAEKATLRLEERIPHREWLISGFPIGGSEVTAAEAARFISVIENSLRDGRMIYIVGQDPVEVLGFSDTFTGPGVDNHALRQSRAAKFCAGVKDFYPLPKTYPDFIRSCDAAPPDQYVGSNGTRAGRAENRSILIRRIAAKPQPDYEGGLPYDPKWGPSAAHCAGYSSVQAQQVLGPIYRNNAICSCLVTPDDPHSNCVRACLQDKLRDLLASAMRGRKPNDPPMDIDLACPIIWKHHRDCYHECGCAHGFIEYPAFDAVCNIALPCAIDSAAINVFNPCMTPTKDDKHLPVK